MEKKLQDDIISYLGGGWKATKVEVKSESVETAFQSELEHTCNIANHGGKCPACAQLDRWEAPNIK